VPAPGSVDSTTEITTHVPPRGYLVFDLQMTDVEGCVEDRGKPW
jgi:hypothetical protein